jgi:hypothetical protein
MQMFLSRSWPCCHPEEGSCHGRAHRLVGKVLDGRSQPWHEGAPYAKARSASLLGGGPKRSLAWLPLAAALLAAEAAAQVPARAPIPFGQNEWFYGTGPLSRHNFNQGYGPGSRYALTRSSEAGSLYFLMRGTTAGSAYFWSKGTEPGSAYFWQKGTTVGSRYYWENGDGCLSRYGWLRGATCEPEAVALVLVVCAAGALDGEPCTAILGVLGADGASRGIVAAMHNRLLAN